MASLISAGRESLDGMLAAKSPEKLINVVISHVACCCSVVV